MHTNFLLFLYLTVKPYVIKAPEDVSAVAGDEIDLACVVGGRPRPELQWMRENGDIPPNRAIVKENSVLNLRNVIPEDQDIYVCRADNPAGSVQVKASVQVHCKFTKFKVYKNLYKGSSNSADFWANGNRTIKLRLNIY